MKKIIPLCFLILILVSGCKKTPKKNDDHSNGYSIRGVPFYEVKISDNFWSPKIETNRKVTIPASFSKCEEMGRMDNFLIAGGKMKGKVKGAMPFDDTDVYKITEGASYSMCTSPDPKMDAYLDSIIEIIKTGQEADGYLTTYKTIDSSYAPAHWCPAGGKWKNLECSHELYNSGHLFEAASAHYLATGKTSFLNIATKNADLLVKVFGAEGNNQVPGHQIVETGLIKLYQITHKQEYLDLARHFLGTRGDSTKRKPWGPYNQDHLPVTRQEEAVGHAVRAAYMYSGMTDIAGLYNDEAYKNAIDKIWENIVFKKLYITGGIGSRHQGEAFGDNYELPNLTAYNETCAAIANVYWNYRMFLLHGDAKYIDVLERSLYNGVISGVGLDGKTFFYPNPLECDMKYPFNQGSSERQPWFDCSCCPTNLCRFMPSIPGYIYAQSKNKLYVNLFIQSSSEINIAGSLLTVRQETGYPWKGNISIQLSPQKESEFTLCLRIPGWAENKPVPGDLYSYENSTSEPVTIRINGEPVKYKKENGYATLTRKWKKGDRIEYGIPMEINKVKANELVADDRGKVAIERGPIVFCVEGADNPDVDKINISSETKLTASYNPELLNGVEIISGNGKAGNTFTAIPYYAWNNRGANKMKVWFPEN